MYLITIKNDNSNTTNYYVNDLNEFIEKYRYAGGDVTNLSWCEATKLDVVLSETTYYGLDGFSPYLIQKAEDFNYNYLIIRNMVIEQKYISHEGKYLKIAKFFANYIYYASLKNDFADYYGRVEVKGNKLFETRYSNFDFSFSPTEFEKDALILNAYMIMKEYDSKEKLLEDHKNNQEISDAEMSLLFADVFGRFVNLKQDNWESLYDIYE